MTLDRARLEIVQATQILCAFSIVDAGGNVSCRHPERAHRFLMSRSKAPALVHTEDVIEHDLDGEPVSRPGVRVILERYLHGEIYRARPDVGAVVHSHCQSVLPFTMVPAAPLRPNCHGSDFLADVGSPFDVLEHGGSGNDLLIRTARLGRALATHLGDSKIVLMRDHGFTAVGATVAQAVFRAVYTAVNSQIQMAATQSGATRLLPPAEAIACESATLSNIDKVWGLWVRMLATEPAGADG